MHKLAEYANKRVAEALPHKAALARIAVKLQSLGTVIDVGAARGAWSAAAMKHWANAHYHLIEAKPSWRPELEKFARSSSNVSLCQAAASDKVGTVFFPEAGDAYGGAAFKQKKAREGLSATPATTIDHEVEANNFKGPFALKLDTHGTEVDILDGAGKTLKETHLICIETYNFMGQQRFPQMLIHLQNLGFRVADIAEPLFRASDASLWQLDFYLLRKDHPCFADFGYS